VLIGSAVSLRWVEPPTSAFMLQARLQALLDGDHRYRTEYHWVDLEAISPQAAIAVIASEDQQFPFHYGFDFQSIREAVRSHERGGKLRGWKPRCPKSVSWRSI
jgi:monofunctional biosynthetic peptidoglycan transglycosylase